MSLPDHSRRIRASLACLCLAAPLYAPAHAQGPPQNAPKPAQAAPRSDLDAFMEKVLARREVNKTALSQYVLDETEGFEVLAPGRVPMHRTRRDFTWYVRDGMHVRSPVRMNGVGVGEQERDEYEERWIRREKERRERAAKKLEQKGQVAITPGGVNVEVGGIPISTEPRFVSEAYFMDFKFEPGNYYLAGREQLEGHEVLRIEYYPTRLFSDTDEERPAGDEKARDRRQKRQERSQEQDIERRMNKTALVTLWVDPAEHQIVKYTFDNVWLDFLPGAWLVRVDELRASMSMGQPFPGVWLPREISIHAGVTLASGSFEAAYGRAFREYREATVKSTIRVPKKVAAAPDAEGDEDHGHGPFAGPEQQAPRVEVIREVRVHGNAYLTDDEVLTFAAVVVGDPVTPEAIESIAKRLRDSGRFDSVEVRKRHRSIDDPTDVALVLIVHEKPGVRSAAEGGVPGPMRRFASKLMFLPVLGYDDGYGFTYGARVSTVDLLGFGERLSVPGTWGGTKRIALEFERPFKTGPLTRVTSSIAMWNRDNPHYDPYDDEMSIDEHREEFTAGVEREFARVFRAGFEATTGLVRFIGFEDRLWTIGATAAVDTRLSPSFPSNAVYAGGGWTALHVEGLDAINRYTADLRGYLRVTGQAVVAGRLQYFTADGPLPPYERFLLGGSPTLRGFRPGLFSADEMLVTGGELRVPITSVLSSATFGLAAFYDAAKSADYAGRLGRSPWEQGAGAGVFLLAPMLQLNLDVAHGIDAGTRVHLSTGFVF